jgi:hypothetical protein
MSSPARAGNVVGAGDNGGGGGGGSGWYAKQGRAGWDLATAAATVGGSNTKLIWQRGRGAGGRTQPIRRF